MLGCEEEVVMLMEESSMKGYQSLPMVWGKLGFVRISRGLGLCTVNMYTLGLHHRQSCVDALDFGGQLLLAYWPGIWLKKQARISRIVSLKFQEPRLSGRFGEFHGVWLRILRADSGRSRRR